jgi:nucleoside 2-deoxyribosyltransferase
MRIYVAGSSRELGRAEGVIGALRAMGHDITHDWTIEVAFSRSRGQTDATYSEEFRRRTAWEDVKGVLRADVVVVLIPSLDRPSRGAWVELGIALDAAHKPFTICVGDYSQSIFCALADRRALKDEDVIAALSRAFVAGDLIDLLPDPCLQTSTI